MAWQPCLRCEQRFTGEAENVYLTRYEGDSREAYRFVVCPECASSLLEEWRTRALYRDDDGDWCYVEPQDSPVPRITLRQALEQASPRLAGPRQPKGRKGA